MIAALLRAPSAVLATLFRHRELTWALARRELSEQFRGRALGWLWAIGQPLLLIALYIFVFGFVFPARMAAAGADEGTTGGVAGSGAAYTIFLLAGLIPWLAFADAMNRSTGSIIFNSALVRQVVFPVETLPAKSAIAAFVTQLVMTAILLLYMLLRGGIPAMALLLPVLLAIQLAAMLGIGLLLATLTVFLRDVREIVIFLTTAGLFLAPILYMPEWVESLSPLARWGLELNPFTHLVRCHRDLLAPGAGGGPGGQWAGLHVLSWAVVIVFAFASLALGGVAWRRCHHVLGELV